MVSVIITCKNDRVVSFEEASEVVVYDMDARKVVHKAEKPSRLYVLEDVAEEFDSCALLTTSVSTEVREVLEEMGLKVVLVKPSALAEILSDIFL